MSDENRKIVTREVKIPLKPQQVADLALEQASKQVELREEEQRARDIAAGHREKIKTIKEDLDQLAGDILAKQKTKKIECYERLDEKTLNVEIVRCDTLEVIDSRPMDIAEREAALQPRLPGVPEEPAPASSDAAAPPATPDMPHAVWCNTSAGGACDCTPASSTPEASADKPPDWGDVAAASTAMHGEEPKRNGKKRRAVTTV